MSTGSLPASSLTWDSFAITDWRWLTHALAWSFALLIAMVFFPWLIIGFTTILGVAGLAALVTAYTDRRKPTGPAAPTLVRYILVDSIFVSFFLFPVFLLTQLALATAGVLPLTAGMGYGHHLVFVFVVGFYLSLGVIGHFQAGEPSLRKIPFIAGALAAGLLVFNAYPRFADDAALRHARETAVAAYEQATGARTDVLAKLSIGNSLHGFDNRVSTVTVDREGRLLVSGGFDYYAGTDARGFVRLLPDGRLDRTFAPPAFGDHGLWAPSVVRLEAGGAMVINTGFRDNTAGPTGLTRMHPDGAVDSSFKPDFLQHDSINQGRLDLLAIQADGKLAVASPARFIDPSHDTCLHRFGSDGSRDATFESTATEALYGSPSSRPRSISCAIANMTTLASGQLLIEGRFPITEMKQGFVRLNPDGTRDASYRAELTHPEYSRSFVTPGGELFAIFYVPIPGSSPTTYEVRCIKLQADGRLDPAFKIPPGYFRRIEQLAMLEDGRVLVSGSLGGTDYGAIVRLLPNGQPDPTFASPEGMLHVDGFLTTLIAQHDGGILLGGEFQTVIGPGGRQRVSRQNIARLLPNGTLDASFDPR